MKVHYVLNGDKDSPQHSAAFDILDNYLTMSSPSDVTGVVSRTSLNLPWTSVH